MGLALPVLKLLIEEHQRYGFRGPVLTLGVQDVGATRDELRALGAAVPAGAEPVSDRELFETLGLHGYEALDRFGIKGATILRDLAAPLSAELHGRFGLVLDGGTLEHVYDIAAALRNVTQLVAPGGVVVHVSPVSGWENHGFYMPQPKLLEQTYRNNGFSDIRAHLVHLSRDGDLREARIVRDVATDGPFATDSARELTLMVLLARRREHDAGFREPVDTHQLRDDLMYWEQEPEFQSLYEQARAVCGPGPKDRYYVLKELLLSMGTLEADTAECGVYRGLGSWLICHYARQMGSSCRHHCFDSFEGLSAPTPADVPRRDDVRSWHAGDMTASLDEVRRALRQFDGIEYHPDWIPQCFEAAAEQRFSFVHLDVDLYEPTRDALSFFHPRLVAGGILLCDDDGFLTCPGARRAVDEFVAAIGARVVRLPTGQAYLRK